MWEVPIIYSNTYRRGARYLIEILIEKISHFNIAYWDCLIKSYTASCAGSGLGCEILGNLSQGKYLLKYISELTICEGRDLVPTSA